LVLLRDLPCDDVQASGEARYASDLPAGVRQPLWASFVLATKSQVQYEGLDESAALKMAGVVRVLNSSHVPGSNRAPGFQLFLEPVRFRCTSLISLYRFLCLFWLSSSGLFLTTVMIVFS